MKNSQTNKRVQCSLEELDIDLPGWNEKQRKDLFDGIQVHGLKKLRKIQRHVGSKTQEDVRIATELYKKEIRNRELTSDMDRQIKEADITSEDCKLWLYLYISSQLRRGAGLPSPAALQAFVDKHEARLRDTELRFPCWRRAEMADLRATIELAPLISKIEQHIPTKNNLEIGAAANAYTIICQSQKCALENGNRVPTYSDLKPGFIYFKCIVDSLKDDEKMKNFEVPPNTLPDLARAQFVLKEWLLPDVGPLQPGWTKDEKYALIVVIETYGSYDFLMIKSQFPRKTRDELKTAISALHKENETKEEIYNKSMRDRFLSVISWGKTLTGCKKSKHQMVAAKRLMAALKELPVPDAQLHPVEMFQPGLTTREMTAHMVNHIVCHTQQTALGLMPLLETIIARASRP